ncbi:DUF952 domain-containing protein [Mycolicibacterium llatzerense]|uniref:Glutathione S-transferase n=1 Tax=Mycolicibacterium llatzerense TaxID=280871 RepID=A0A0D1J389_9MYCO|nr:DUF952 domain-containing protein [Mycolicibacterium llatzerense]KIU16058.1 glutathione S-transferase [Mycolicibacterium llatzerense]
MIPSPTVLVHLCSETDWAGAQFDGELRPPSLDLVGFVHLSAPEQVHLPANRLYRGQSDLILLVCDPGLLGSPVRWEPGVATDPESMLFPHLYGPLPAAAVTRTVPYRPAGDGVFAALPANFPTNGFG